MKDRPYIIHATDRLAKTPIVSHRAFYTPTGQRAPVTAQAKRNRLMRLGRMMEAVG